jgi:mannose-6-phosphate isomerase-like protein (cupin superfamily)
MRRTLQPVWLQVLAAAAAPHQGFPVPPTWEAIGTVTAVHAFGVANVVERLRNAGGGYEIVHESPGLELGVYVLVAPEPDRQQPHEDDEIYVGLEGTGVLEVGDESVPIDVGQAIFVEAGVEHRFTAYEQLAVLVIFERAPR